jgi:hypothetical protein
VNSEKDLYSIPERIIEIISQIPRTKAIAKETMPSIDMPKILGPALVACIMAELSRIALMIMLKATCCGAVHVLINFSIPI